jgi:O-antigen/teichoic acid export membrane protein
MKKYLKQILGESAIYGLSGVITSFIGMFLMPIYTSVFEPRDYGIIALMGTTSTLISMFIIFGMDNAVSLWYWDKPDDKERRKTISCWYFFLTALSLLAGAFFIFFPGFFSNLILNSSSYSKLIFIFGFNLLFSGYQKIANIWFRIRRKPILAVSYSLFISLLTIGLNILFVLQLKMGLEGIYYSQLIASFAGFILTTIVLFKWISLLNVDWTMLKEMLRFSLPLIPAAIVFWLMSSASAYFINLYVADKAEVGLYQVGATIASVLGLGTWAFLQAWPPFALSIHKEINAPRVYSLVFEIYCVLGFFAAFCMFLFSKEILYIFTNANYSAANHIIGLLSINAILLGIPGILSIANNIKKKNSPYAVAVMIGSLFTITFFVLLIPRIGKEGAAVSMIIGNSIIAVYLGYKAQQLFFIPYHFKRIIGIVLIESMAFTLMWRFVDQVYLKIMGVLALGIIIYLIYFRIQRKSVLENA